MTEMQPPPAERGGVALRPFRGAEIEAVAAGVARLRLSVFRDFPYLYDGALADEEAYLSAYREDPRAFVVGAFDGETLIGAATGSPMAGQHEEWAEPFRARGVDLSEIFYCGESVLSSAYRGRGLGHAFFDWREAEARALGASLSAFCSVIRPDDHPARPPDYRPLDAFWRKRGYAPAEGLVAVFDWRDVGAAEESAHRLQFWLKTL